MQKIKSGDQVELIAGKDKGFRGEVLKVNPKEGKIIVEGLNIAKKHQRAQARGDGQQTPAAIVDRPMPLDWSNAMVVCPSCDERTRVGFHMNDDDKKVRFCKKCDSDIDNPV